MNYSELYDAIQIIQQRLRYDPEILEERLKVKALAATYDLQNYLAHELNADSQQKDTKRRTEMAESLFGILPYDAGDQD